MHEREKRKETSAVEYANDNNNKPSRNSSNYSHVFVCDASDDD